LLIGSILQNRQHLLEISPNNKETLKLVESANLVLVFDENEPKNMEEIGQLALNGDFHSKWSDRSSTVIAYKNGKFACIGEVNQRNLLLKSLFKNNFFHFLKHSAYDGTISVSYVVYIELCFLEEPEPDWDLVKDVKVLNIRELHFDLDDFLKEEIQKMFEVCDKMVRKSNYFNTFNKKTFIHYFQRTDIIVTYDYFNEYGKEFIKTHKLHPDSFVQVVLQWAYTQLHKE